MEIIKTTIIKQAIVETINAKYNLEYTISNNILSSVHASIMKLTTDANQHEIHLGTISLDNQIINCSITGDSKTIAYFEDFVKFLDLIKEDVNSQTSKTQLKKQHNDK